MYNIEARISLSAIMRMVDEMGDKDFEEFVLHLINTRIYRCYDEFRKNIIEGIME